MSKIKTIYISGKCADRCDAELYDEEGKRVLEHQGYVPDFMPGGGGDYLQFEIDNETGKILNWEPIKEDVLEKENE